MKAGHTVIAYGRTPAKLDACVALGAQRGASNADVGARAPIVITMLPDGPEVEEVVLGPDGILSGAKPGSLIIDMSSISPLVSQKIAAACAQKGVDFIDAPVSGGEPKAIDGTLAIMVGGSEEVFRKAEPILKCMGSSVTLTGPVGAGNTTKLANQIMVACNIAAMGEALTLATRCGLNPEVVVNAVKGGLAGSAVLNAKGPMLIARNFKPGFRIQLAPKGPAQRAANRGGEPRLPAAHRAGAADALVAHRRRQRRSRSLGHRNVCGGGLARRSESAVRLDGGADLSSETPQSPPTTVSCSSSRSSGKIGSASTSRAARSASGKSPSA